MNMCLFKITSLVVSIGFLLSITPATAQAANVNNFEITQYDIAYKLSKDHENRSILTATETIAANFPASDQNHGIERALPNTYDNHPTSLKILSVTNKAGSELPYETYESNNNTVVRIGDPDRYVHGRQTYKLTYSQRDVTKYFTNTNADEFYWDTNGTEWAVPIKSLTISLSVDDQLRPMLNGNQRCYAGVSGSTTRCTLARRNTKFTASAINLSPGENLTLAVGFNPHTFANYQQSLGEKLLGYWMIMLAITLLIAIILIIWLCIEYWRRANRTKDIGTVVPEYIPPKDMSVSVSASISNKYGSVFSAQLIDLAVRHYLKIYQTREKSLFRQANYELEIIKDISKLHAEEREVLTDIFSSTTIGSRLDMASIKRSRLVRSNLQDNLKKLRKDIAGSYRLRAPDPAQSNWFKRAALFIGIGAILTLSPWLLAVALASFILAFTLKPLTDKGLALARYLKGLEMYIKTAEKDRLKMLQSPEGAEKIGAIDTKDTRQLIKLYERVLPYAMIFGQEKEWNKQLGHYYESLHESPGWYSGHNAVFNAAVFSAAISNFNQVASYSDPTSASSGGSGGGGFSGGGGGGGGGGGW